MSTIQNHNVGLYLGVKTTVEGVTTTTFNRLGEGFTNFTPSNNGTINSKQYINKKFATSKRSAIAKQWAISGDRVTGNAVNDFIASLSEKTGTDVETELIIVDLLNPTTQSSTTTYPAKKYAVMIDVGNDGGVEGGADVTIDATLYANSEAVEGTVIITPATSSAEEYVTFTATV